MSGIDAAARGLAVRAGTDAGRRSRVLMAAGPSGPIYGGSGATYVTVHSVTLPPETIVPGSTLRFNMLLAKYPPNNAGHAWQLRIGSAIVAQNSVGGGIATAAIEQILHIAYDRKAAYAFNRNALNTPSLDTTGLYAFTGATTSATASLGARLPSNVAMFVDNSAPPTVETTLVDFRQPVTVSLDIKAINGDTIEVLGAMLELVALGNGGQNFANGKATAVWGDSLTEGTGSSAVSGVPMDWVAQMRRQRAGWPIAVKGLGGQKSAAIVDRLVSDAVAGLQWNAVIWIGTNDFDDHIGDGPGWFAAVKAQIDQALAYRTSPNTIICNLHPRANWAVGDANYQAMQYVNAQLAAAYGSRVCDLFTALATDGGKVPAANMADTIHLANAGYTVVMQAVNAKISALGW